MNGATPLTRSREIWWKSEPLRIAFQYFLTTLASLIAGWLLPRFFGEALWQEAARAVSAHFERPFVAASSVREMLYIVFSFFVPTLLCIALVAVFSFSSLSCLVTDGVLIYLGMRTGCTVSILARLFRGIPSLSYQPRLLCFFLFLLFKILLLTVFFSYALRMAKYSYRLRVYSETGRAVIQSRVLCSLLLQVCQCTAVLFVLHFLYGYSIYFASK